MSTHLCHEHILSYEQRLCYEHAFMSWTHVVSWSQIYVENTYHIHTYYEMNTGYVMNTWYVINTWYVMNLNYVIDMLHDLSSRQLILYTVLLVSIFYRWLLILTCERGSYFKLVLRTILQTTIISTFRQFY